MRIALLVRALPCHRLGGLEYHTLDLARSLARRGHQLTIVTSRHPDGIPSEQLGDGVEAVYLAAGSPGDYSIPFFRSVRSVVDRLDKTARFDVIHAQEFAAFGLPRYPGRLVTTVHGTLFSETPLNRRYQRRLAMLERLRALRQMKARVALWPWFWRSLERSDLIIVDSLYTRRELLLPRPSLRPKIHLVPLGIDPLRYPDADRISSERSPGRNPLRIGILGRVQRMKGLEVAIGAARLLKQREVPFHLTIAGSGRDSESLQALSRESGLESQVTFAGRVPPDLLPAFFRDACDLFLFPDLTQPAFGLVAVEAMLYGTPVIAARSGAIPETVTETCGWLYDPWNTLELAALLQHIEHDRAQLAGKGAAAAAHARTFTADRMAENAESVYARLPSTVQPNSRSASK